MRLPPVDVVDIRWEAMDIQAVVDIQVVLTSEAPQRCCRQDSEPWKHPALLAVYWIGSDSRKLSLDRSPRYFQHPKHRLVQPIAAAENLPSLSIVCFAPTLCRKKKILPTEILSIERSMVFQQRG